MKLEKKHWIIIVVIAAILVWYFFLRKKKTESSYRKTCGVGQWCCKYDLGGCSKCCEIPPKPDYLI